MISAIACSEWDKPVVQKDPIYGGYKSTDDAPLGMETSEVFWWDINVLNYIDKVMPSIEGKENIYRFYLDVHRMDPYRPSRKYNLQEKPVDVCFQMQSAEVMQLGARTNVVTIPKEAIAAALAASK